MKHLIKLALIVMLIYFGGCYTVLWSPQEQLPSENNTQVYYSEPYYGEYNYYYDNPWWITARPLYVTPPEETQSSERSRNATSIDGNSNVTSTPRNNNGSRNNPDNNGSVIRTATPSRNSNSSDNNPVYKNNTSNNSGEQTRSSENSRSNEGNNSARNNNGNRNSGNGRR
jgi:hypothetical protein